MGVWNVFRRSVLAWTALVVAAVLSSAAPPARAEEQKDERLGYSFTYPRKWQKRPVAADERWIVAKFECDREFEDADPKTSFWSRHRPWIDVVVIPLALENRKGGTVEKGPDGKVVLKLAAPWTDLKGYLEKTLQYGQGGFYFSKEEEQKVGTYRCMQYEVTFDKLIDTPKRIYAWAFYTEDAIYGFVGESLVRFEDKVKPDLLAAFKTFKAFQRTGMLAGADQTAEDLVTAGGEKVENLDEDGLQRLREQRTTKRLIKIKDSLASDWTVKESEHFIAVSHSDAKHTKSVLDHCEALRDWLDKNMGFIGTGYAGRIIVRICKDRDEHDAFTKTGGWSGDNIEVNTFKDRDGWSDWSMTSLNQGIFRIWGRDRNPSVEYAMPRWIRSGMDSVVGTAKSKGSKIEFPADLWDKETLAIARRDGKLLPAKSFFSMTSEDLWKDYEVGRQSEHLARFLLVGSARKSPKYKNLFADYVKAVVFLVDEAEAARAKAERAAKAARDAGPDGAPPPSDEPKDEKEEEERIRARERSWASEEKDFLDKVNQRIFGDWTQKDWDALNAAYQKELE